MAWRPSDLLIDGELNNTTPGRITGWLRFVGLSDKVTLDLAGDFHRDIRGAKIRLTGDKPIDTEATPESVERLAGFVTRQTGDAGDITAGLPPADYTSYPYIEWYSHQNGRVVIEQQPEQVQVVGRPIPAIESDPVAREKQNRQMQNFLGGIVDGLNNPPEG